jgi:hypothetical protein
MGTVVEVPRWAAWEARAGEPAVQELIRRSIRRGEIRVVPGPEGGIRIIPQRNGAAARPGDMRPADADGPAC